MKQYLKKFLVTLLIWSSFAFVWVQSTYAQQNTLQTWNVANASNKKACPKWIWEVLNSSLMEWFDLWRTLQCKWKWENTAIITIVNWIFNVFIFPIILLLVITKMVKMSWDSQGWGWMSYGGWQSAWIGEWLKNYLSSKWTEIALLIIIFWIWQLWFLDLFVFFIRAGLKSFWTDAWDLLEV